MTTAIWYTGGAIDPIKDKITTIKDFYKRKGCSGHFLIRDIFDINKGSILKDNKGKKVNLRISIDFDKFGILKHFIFKRKVKKLILKALKYELG